ncbi:MAG: DUF6514 family protein [Acutalibacteraceae bacterium]|nr:DUF6514 family protein [Acutalibacteraceae bacterium]
MITKYEILEQEKYIEYNGIIKTYGIAYKGENETKIIEDISDDISEVEDLVKILNEFDVDLVHFPAIVNDFITVKYS